jgi:hypothetical protein
MAWASSQALHMVSFENFVKSLPPSLSELKVKPIFFFPIKIRDDPTASIIYIPASRSSHPTLSFLKAGLSIK